MKPITLKRSSFIYRAIRYLLNESPADDTCGLLAQLLRCLGTAIGIPLVACAAIAVLGCFALVAGSGMFLLWIFPPESIEAFWILLALSALCWFGAAYLAQILFLDQWLRENSFTRIHVADAVPDSLAELLTSWAQKICVPIRWA